MSVCQLFCWASHLTIAHDALDITIQATPSHLSPSVPDIGPHFTGTTLLLLSWPLPSDMFQLVNYETHTVGKQAVGILLECFLATDCKEMPTEICCESTSAGLRKQKPNT